MTLKEQIELMQAAEGGEEIQVRSLICGPPWGWRPFDPEKHAFNWVGCEYRVRPKPLKKWCIMDGDLVRHTFSAEWAALNWRKGLNISVPIKVFIEVPNEEIA